MWRFISLALLAVCLLGAADTDPLKELASTLAANKLEEARSWERTILVSNASSDTLLHAGALFAQYDMLPEAEAIFEKCSQRFPSLFEAKYNLTLSQIGLSNYAAAEQSLRAISPSSSRETAAVEYLQGKIETATGHPAEARQSLESAYRANPTEENYALDLALLDIQSSAYVPAIHILEPSLGRHPESEDLAIELALADSLAGRNSDALSLCHKLTAQNPQLPAPRLIAAFANCAAANYGACESEAVTGLSLRGASTYLHYLYAEALWNSGSRDGSKILDELNAAIMKLPSCNVCLFLRSQVFEAEKDNRAAIADLESALQQDSQSGQAWYRLSALHRKNGEPAEAEDALRHYRALHEQQTNQEVESFRKQFLTK